MKETVHQAVHGYERGHVELASSVRLDRADRDLLERLSDLSGALSEENGFGCYLTVYPLPSGRYYALAQTWLDQSAPRAGCVLTHTLLVPSESWGTSDDPQSFAALFRKPSRENLESFRSPLTPVPRCQDLREIRDSVAVDFAMRFFGEGLRPLVVFGATAPEVIAWRLVVALWPSLRERFSCCTYALKPRALDERPFDLLFAPESAFSRFAGYPRENVVRASSAVVETGETWLSRWASCIFGNPATEGGTRVIARVKRLSRSLEPFPTAIRRVFLYLELSERADNVPMAALGALDALASLRISDEEESEAVRQLVESSLRAVARVVPLDALELLYLLARRIGSVQDRDVELGIRRSVAEVLKGGDVSVLVRVEDLVGRQAADPPEAFLAGVADALAERLAAVPSDISTVLTLPTLGRLLLARFPETAVWIINAGRDAGEVTTVRTLTEWCSQVQGSPSRAALRRQLLPVLTAELPLAEELLREVDASETATLCDAIEAGPAARSAESSFRYAEAFSHRGLAQEWAERNPAETYFSAFMLALSLPIDEGSLAHLLEKATQGSRIAVAAIAFIEECSRRGGLAWLKARLATNASLWLLLVSGLPDAYVVAALERICVHLRRSAIARVPRGQQIIVAGSVAIQEHALRQLILDWVDGECSVGMLSAWFAEPWAGSLVEGKASIVRDCITAVSEWTRYGWLRGWRLLEVVPQSKSVGSAAIDVIDHLVHKRPSDWPSEASEYWYRVIARFDGFPSVHVEMCARALQFCIEHPRLPVGSVAALAFYPVHQAVLQQRSASWSIFGFLQWDRGLEVRRRLVDAFCQGCWPPEWFVIAARESWLLRKLCRRMLRQWKGEEFLRRAYDALRSQGIPVHQDLIKALQEILAHPRYEEDWD